MAVPIKIVRCAARQIAEASEWWQANRPAIPEALEDELRRGLAVIAQQPGMGAGARNAKPPTYPRPVWDALGQAALEARQWTRAESAFRRALEQFPASPGAKRGLDAARLRGERVPSVPRDARR